MNADDILSAIQATLDLFHRGEIHHDECFGRLHGIMAVWVIYQEGAKLRAASQTP